MVTLLQIRLPGPPNGGYPLLGTSAAAALVQTERWDTHLTANPPQRNLSSGAGASPPSQQVSQHPCPLLTGEQPKLALRSVPLPAASSARDRARIKDAIRRGLPTALAGHPDCLCAGGGQRKTSCLCTPWIFLWCNKMKDLPKCSNYTGGCTCSSRSERCPLQHCNG